MAEADHSLELPTDPTFGARDRSRVVTSAPGSPIELIVQLTSVPSPWIWRGQGDATWPLLPRLNREFAGLPPFDEPGVDYDYAALENKLVGFFKTRARRILPRLPSETDILAWLALMQHYGAPTRLLDWSASPFVGLFFACSGEPAASGHAALWALNAHFCRREHRGTLLPTPWDHLGVHGFSRSEADGTISTRWPTLEISQRDRENEMLRSAIRTRQRWPLPVIPFDVDERMAAQQTVMTCVGDLTAPVEATFLDVSRWHERASEPPPGGYMIGSDATAAPMLEPADVVHRFIIPNGWHGELLDVLGRMNVEESTLFPGLDGIGRQTARYLQRPPLVHDLIAEFPWPGTTS